MYAAATCEGRIRKIKITEMKMRLILRSRLRRPGGAKRFAARPGG